ncbi:hypothetical protein L6R52_39175, partial [Myxococcota bacterium]|nr:hypothetical protein [Myxococcota bacterium]
RARCLLDAGASRNDIQQSVGVPPFALDKVIGQAKRQPAAALVQGLQVISRVDRELKGGALAPARAMERLVLDLMG